MCKLGHLHVKYLICNILLLWQIVGDTSGPIVGSSLVTILENAKKYKKEFGDDFVSVEHLLLAFTSDKRFGHQLFKKLQLGEKELKEAVSAVRGSQRVTDQSMAPEFIVFAPHSYRNIKLVEVSTKFWCILYIYAYMHTCACK